MDRYLYYPITDYGALCDGSTDDAAAFTRAISACPAGGTVFVPAATVVGSTITVNKSLRVLGTGLSSVTAKASAGIAPIFSITADNVTIEWLKIDGNRANNGMSHGTGSAAIFVTANSFRLLSCELTGAFQYGVELQPATSSSDILGFLFQGNYIHDNGANVDGGAGQNWGVGIQSFANGSKRPRRLRVIGNRFERNYSTYAASVGVNAFGAAVSGDMVDVVIVANDILDCYNGGGMIAESGANGIRRNWRIIGNHFELTATDPAGSLSSGIECTGIGVIIIGNTFVMLGQYAAALQPIGANDTSEWVFVGNHVYSCRGGVASIASVTGGAKYVAVSGNVFDSITAGSLAVSLQQNDRFWSVGDNTFYNSVLPIYDPSNSAAISNNTGHVSSQAETALTLANGDNNDISPSSSNIRISGPTAAFAITGIQGLYNYPGARLVFYNSTAQQLTIKNESASSTAANRIKTLTGANVVLRAGTSSFTVMYDSTDSRWILVGSN